MSVFARPDFERDDLRAAGAQIVASASTGRRESRAVYTAREQGVNEGVNEILTQNRWTARGCVFSCPSLTPFRRKRRYVRTGAPAPARPRLNKLPPLRGVNVSTSEIPAAVWRLAREHPVDGVSTRFGEVVA